MTAAIVEQYVHARAANAPVIDVKVDDVSLNDYDALLDTETGGGSCIRKTQEELIRCLNELCLSTIRGQYSRIADEAKAESLSHEQFLFNLVRQECDSRRNKRIERYLKESRFAVRKKHEQF